MFHSHEDLLAVVDSCIQMIDELQARAALGGPLRLYINELILGSNTVLLELDGSKMAMITYSVFGYLITRDERFTARAFDNFNSLLSRASLISESGEKERTRFFNSLREKVNALKA
jgi:hypothetical protein